MPDQSHDNSHNLNMSSASKANSEALAKIDIVQKTQAQIDAETKNQTDTSAEPLGETMSFAQRLNQYAEKLRLMWQSRADLGDERAIINHYDFLPAALEIQQAPPNKVVVWVGRLLVSLFVIGVIWACIGKVNVVAVAEGKIIPSSRIKQIQPLEKGVVNAVFVKDGQLVQQGEKLVELDRTLTAANMVRLQHGLLAAELDAARFDVFIGWVKDAVEYNVLQRNARQESAEDSFQEHVESLKENSQYNKQLNARHSILANQIQLLNQQEQQYLSQLGASESSLQAKQAQLEKTEAQISKLEQTLPIITQRAQKFKNLMQKKMVAEDEYLHVEQDRIESQQDLSAQRAQKRQLSAEVEEVKKRMSATKAETLAQSYQQLTEANTQIDSITQELSKAADLNAKQILYAPVAGRVQELQINTIGGVVTEAQNLMTIVPLDQVLEVQAFLENKDIGFVEEGMPAEIKVNTFPFTKYGIIDAKVSNITTDALSMNQEQQDKGLVFAMHLTMAKNTIVVNGKEILLHPGMQVSAEVKIGKRRIIEYIVMPLLKGFKESVRER